MDPKHRRQRGLVGVRPISLAEATAQLVGQEYELGHMDCFTLIILYLRIRRVPLPDMDSFRGVSLSDYPELYQSDPEYALNLMVDLMNTLLNPVVANRTLPGDVLLVKLKGISAPPALAIDGGNGMVMIANNKRGVITVPSRNYSKLKGWQCHPQRLYSQR